MSIDAEYLDALRAAYAHHRNSTGEVRVLSFDTSTLDLSSEAQLSAMYKKIMDAAAIR